jgi:hypothetical protein
MDEQLEFVKQIAERLAAAEIEYMMTGSMAMAIYASPRMTRDVDVVVDVTQADVTTLVRSFEADCYIDRDAVAEAVKAHGMFNVIHNEWIIKADFIVRKIGPYRQLEFERRRQIDVEGTEVSVVAPEDLILSKLLWAQETGSVLQLRDVHEIIVSGTKLDWQYLETWSTQLGVAGLLREEKESD